MMKQTNRGKKKQQQKKTKTDETMISASCQHGSQGEACMTLNAQPHLLSARQPPWGGSQSPGRRPAPVRCVA